ncbi:sodium:solute symporter [Serratia fonticola]|nr:sodium:solute symporter [Serratia fonticola]MBP0998215.1 sodium:solute symporter [Serratia fonticola]
MKNSIYTWSLMTLFLSALAGIGLTAGFFFFIGLASYIWRVLG